MRARAWSPPGNTLRWVRTSAAELFAWCPLDPQRTPILQTEPGAPTLGTRHRRGSLGPDVPPRPLPVMASQLARGIQFLRNCLYSSPGQDWDASNPRPATEHFLQGARGDFPGRHCNPTSTTPTEPLPRARRGAGHSAAREGTPALSTSRGTCGPAADGHPHLQASEVTGRSHELAFLVLFPLSLFSTF